MAGKTPRANAGKPTKVRNAARRVAAPREHSLPFSLSDRHDRTIDAKNRLQIASRLFTDRSLRAKGKRFLVAPSILGREGRRVDYLVVVPEAGALELLDAKFKAAGITDSGDRAVLAEQYRSNGQVVPLDKQGRIVLPEALARLVAEKDGKVRVTPEGTHLRIWRPDRHDEHVVWLDRQAHRIAEKRRRGQGKSD